MNNVLTACYQKSSSSWRPGRLREQAFADGILRAGRRWTTHRHSVLEPMNRNVKRQNLVVDLRIGSRLCENSKLTV